jgi:aspartyl-tRNA synthetase
VTTELGASPGDLLIFAAHARGVAQGVLGGLRLELADRFGLRADTHDVFWVVDFPMFEFNADEQRWDSLHHPFTAPLGDLDGDPGALRSRAYDLILDGTELGGGSIRINTVEVQQRVLELIGMDEQEAHERFGFLLEALRYGAPPLGGIAFGVDRAVAIMAGLDSIRDVIAFPKTASGADPMSGAPSPVDERQLRELGLKLAAAKAGVAGVAGGAR